MDQPLFNPNENEEQITPGVQDISLNLNSQTKNQESNKFITTPSDFPQIQTPQLINHNAKKGKIYLSDLNTFCIRFKIEDCEISLIIFFILFGSIFAISGIIALTFNHSKIVDIVGLTIYTLFGI